jgi:hypothetical protein
MSPSLSSFCARARTASGAPPWVAPTWRIETMLDRAWRSRARKSALRPGSRAATAVRAARVSNSSARPARVGAPSWARRARARRSVDRGRTRSRPASSSANGRAVRAASARVAAARAAPAASRARCWPVSSTATRPSSCATFSDDGGETAATLGAPWSGWPDPVWADGAALPAGCWTAGGVLAPENQVGPNRARAAPGRHAEDPEGDQRPEARPQEAAASIQRRVARSVGVNGIGSERHAPFVPHAAAPRNRSARA